jgi:regulator of PEP synthase PpsR (kinase-PPPase family)
MSLRTVFFVSDQTGVTSETLGNSLMTQFDGLQVQRITLPFLESADKAREAVQTINATARADGQRPVVFSTLVQDHLREIFVGCDGFVLDFFQTFLGPLERELGLPSAHAAGRAHGIADSAGYDRRIEATNFALSCDDGARTRDYSQADIVLVGVSRSGKTPTSLYLALQYGIFTANFPLTEDEFEGGGLTPALAANRSKLYGLTIEPGRLVQIREARRPGSRYASPQQVSYELRRAEGLYGRYKIPHLDATQRSVEEIASWILDQTGLKRPQL